MVIQDELDRMNRFVDDLLLLAALRRPDFLRPEPLDLDLLTHEVFAKARLLGDRGWVLEGPGSDSVHADPQRLTQAVTNLAANAANHTGARRADLDRQLAERRARPHLGPRRGPRDRPEEQQRIFERFARSQSVRHAAAVPASGLAIVDAIAEAHGGHVELDSALGAGAKFTIVIPVQESHPTKAGSSGPHPDRRGRGAARVVPREGTARERLHDHGRPRRAEPPRRATTDFDLLILDLGLPGKDGLEVLRELRSAGSACR